MELQNREEIKNDILQSWLRVAWVYPMDGPDGRVYLRLTPGGRLKLRKRIKELEAETGESGADLARQEEAGTLPLDRKKMELSMMVQAYSSERKFIESQGQALGRAGVDYEAPEPRSE
ncbi:Hypothetical Protein RradSPS_2527 [Rubrobacter radiotolerans]|uniref:Uncharacterized protein n=1 Tax=Rubrobacter radiotolerans TaxID=42256 RepID=A0A023X705_RUBRA|nr:hypothetical protein [Rubrobacter radiotolerans]AHY47810.1 Hypothetical Protein RradSPS_2527 [Rubrobacter radiotolerans]MDX5892449.1 hypothetical protein [Rubrobacter radiotolerans]SMC07740.1 conserved hypothetical protein [Rubrobacter radiotolerans DSM 5868]